MILEPIPANIDAAASALRAGRLVAFPTETVYGLGADAGNDLAVAAIFAAKNRPRFNPLIVHVTDIDAARELVTFDSAAERLAARFWPGGLTLVLPRRKDAGISPLVGAGLDTLAIRVPRHAVARSLLVAAGRPLVAPSANRSGKVSPTTADHVLRSLGGRIDMILDGGRCEVGIESTVIDLTGTRPILLRPGAVSLEDIETCIGPIDCSTGNDEAAPKSPGRLAAHYAPELPLRLDVLEARAGEALLAFGPTPLPGARSVANLSPSGDLTEAAANLFGMLQALDQPGFIGIAVMPIPERGLGRAINDRLRRAASGGR